MDRAASPVITFFYQIALPLVLVVACVLLVAVCELQKNILKNKVKKYTFHHSKSSHIISIEENRLNNYILFINKWTSARALGPSR